MQSAIRQFTSKMQLIWSQNGRKSLHVLKGKWFHLSIRNIISGIQVWSHLSLQWYDQHSPAHKNWPPSENLLVPCPLRHLIWRRLSVTVYPPEWKKEKCVPVSADINFSLWTRCPKAETFVLQENLELIATWLIATVPQGQAQGRSPRCLPPSSSL